jgi:hypothetical protein
MSKIDIIICSQFLCPDLSLLFDYNAALFTISEVQILSLFFFPLQLYNANSICFMVFLNASFIFHSHCLHAGLDFYYFSLNYSNSFWNWASYLCVLYIQHHQHIALAFVPFLGYPSYLAVKVLPGLIVLYLTWLSILLHSLLPLLTCSVISCHQTFVHIASSAENSFCMYFHLLILLQC